MNLNLRQSPKVISDKFYSSRNRRKSRWCLTSGGLEPVLDTGGGKNSIFAKSLIRTLFENTKQYITPREIFEVVGKDVSNKADQTPSCGPIKGVGDAGGEFILVRSLKKISTILCPVCLSQKPWPCRACGGTSKCTKCSDLNLKTCIYCSGKGRYEKGSLSYDLWGELCEPCKGEGKTECLCKGEGCTKCLKSGVEPLSCPVCYGQEFFVRAAVICNFCLGKGFTACAQCRKTGECTFCDGSEECDYCSGEGCSICKDSGRCTHCLGSGKCESCGGHNRQVCIACHGVKEEDARLLWWNSFSHNVKTGVVEELVNDYQATFPLLPEEGKCHIIPFVEHELKRLKFPSNTLLELMRFSYSHTNKLAHKTSKIKPSDNTEYLFILCSSCKKKNRVPISLLAKPLNCGSCGNSLKETGYSL